jgi:hypothetical protein
MISVSFKYNPLQKESKAYGFSYAFGSADSYNFEYRRSRLYIDTAFFDEHPVTVEKIATGFILDALEDVSKLYHDVNLVDFSKNTYTEYHKQAVDIMTSEYVFIYKKEKNVSKIKKQVMVSVCPRCIKESMSLIRLNDINKLYIQLMTRINKENDLDIDDGYVRISLPKGIKRYEDEFVKVPKHSFYGKEIWGEEPINHNNILEQIIIKRPNPGFDVYRNSITITNKIAEELITNVNKTCIANKEDYYNARIFDTLTLKESSQLIVNILRGTLYPFNINDTLNYYDYKDRIIYKNNIKYANGITNILAERIENKYIYQITYISMSERLSYYRLHNNEQINAVVSDESFDHLSNYSVRGAKLPFNSSVVSKTLLGQFNGIRTKYYNYANFSSIKSGHNSSVKYDNAAGIKNTKQSYCEYCILMHSKNYHDGLVFNHSLVIKNGKSADDYTNKIVSLYKAPHYSIIVGQSILSGEKTFHDTTFQHDYNTTYKFDKDLSKYNIDTSFYVKYKDTYLKLGYPILFGLKHIVGSNTRLDYSDEFVEKVSKKNHWYKKTFGIHIYEITYEMNRFALRDFVYKIPKDMNRFYSDDFAKRIPYDFDRYEQSWHSCKKSRESRVADALLEFYREYYKPQTANIVIPISKIYGSGMTDDIVWLYKKFRCSLIEDVGLDLNNQTVDIGIPITDDFASKTFRLSGTHNAIIRIIKSQFRSELLKNDIVYKIPHDSPTLNNDSLCKVSRSIFLDYKNNIWLQRQNIYIKLDEFTNISKEKKITDFFNDLVIFSTDQKKYINNSLKVEWLEKVPNICYYKNGLFMSNEHIYDMEKFQQQFLKRNENILHYYDFVSIQNDTLKRMFEADDMEHATMSKDVYEDKIDEWAWVYEEEPFEPNYGVDELLLPENDTRYEDFESLIWDRELMVPIDPVEQIDTYEFIAKFPNKYPLKDADGNNKYEDVAKAYYGVKVEQYYGIKVTVMRKVFLSYWSIWQNHIFEFAAMNQVQALNKMLDYLYSWILNYFNDEDLPHALRVFRQIRWYGETAVIKNSQYHITYIPDDLTSGSLEESSMPDIKSSLGLHSTMYVDTDLHVIRNGSAFLHEDSWLEMYVFNKVDTTFEFSLSTTTPVHVYVNNTLIDVITQTGVKYIYPLQYTGFENTIRIERKAANNIDNAFYIGNIIIRDCGIHGDLSIDFDNSKKDGNKLMNFLAQKVVAYTNLMGADPEFWKNLTKSNMAVSECYNLIKQYWDLHWNSKQKGKRLTIKRTPSI